MRSFLLRSLLVTAVPTLALLGCNDGSSGDTGTAVSSSVQRNKSPKVAAGDEATLVTGNSDFAFGLYHGLSSGDTTGNLFYSPYSVSLALAMTYAGAAGTTATQMASALHFTLPASRLDPAFDELDLAVQTKPAGATGQDGQPFAVTVADALWGDQSVTFQQSFVDTLAGNYGANLRKVDFTHQPAQAEAAINTWVANNTDDKIDPLLAPGTIQSGTEFVIVNAVYFNASWATTFEKVATHTGTFTRPDGSTVQTSLMLSDEAATTYAKGANWQAVELPYSGNTTSMVIVLPDTGAYAAVEQGLSGAFYASVTAALAPTEIEVVMPSFKIHGGTVSLAPELKALGMIDAFDAGKADFTAMIPAGGVSIADVLHQAFVDVDESGTEAAAATGVIGVGSAAPEPTVNVTVDHPFFFFIRDVASNTVLFAGREGDPTQ